MFDDWREELAARDRERQYERLSGRAIREALAAMSHLAAFHTSDVARHARVEAAHGRPGGDRNFHQLIERYLAENAIELGIRGPLPGIDELGSRWYFRPDY